MVTNASGLGGHSNGKNILTFGKGRGNYLVETTGSGRKPGISAHPPPGDPNTLNNNFKWLKGQRAQTEACARHYESKRLAKAHC